MLVCARFSITIFTLVFILPLSLLKKMELLKYTSVLSLASVMLLFFFVLIRLIQGVLGGKLA